MGRKEHRTFRRWRLRAAILLVAGLATVTRAQSPPAVTSGDHRGYRDLVPLEAGAYGVELRGTDDPARIEARIGPNTAVADRFRTARVPAKVPHPFVVKWSARDVSVSAGGSTINHRAAWQTGDAVRISARGDARVTIATAGGKHVGQTIAGTALPGTPSDLILAGAHLTGNWTLEGTIDWPDEPRPGDAVLVTVGVQEPVGLPLDRRRPNTFTGGSADPFVFSPPSGIAGQPRAGAPITPTVRWDGPNGSRNWSTTTNWLPQRAPVAGDVVSLPAGAERNTVNDVDAGDPVLGGISVSIASYFLDGNGLRLGPGSSSQIDGNFGVASLEGSGTIELLRQTILTVGSEGRSPAKSSTTFSGTLIGDRGELWKDGSGSIIFTGNASGIERTNVREGMFFLRDGGRLSLVSVTKESGRLIEGRFVMTDGTVQQLRVLQGGVFGDASAGTGSVTGPLVDFQATFQMEGMKYQQKIDASNSMKVFVTGEVRLSYNGFSQLHLIPVGPSPAQGTNLFMVINDGTDPVSGLFRHPDDAQVTLPEGATVTVGGVSYTLSYRCNAEKAIPACDGTGNDIGLTVISGGARPDLTITKIHPGNFTQGQSGATYTITVTNSGTAPTSGTITVTDVLPTGLTATAFAGTGWTCAALPALSCTHPGPIADGASAPALMLTVRVASNAPPSVTNTAEVSGGGESNTGNNTATDVTTILAASGANLTIDKAHTGNFTRGQTGIYTIVVRNIGEAPTVDATTVTDVLPSGLTATAFSGTGWTCTLTPALSCTHAGQITGGGDFAPPLTLTVNVATNAPPSVTNTATVSGGGDATPANNSDSDITTIVGEPDLTITKTHTGNFTRGQTGTYTITVTNSGGVTTTGTITVADTLPAGLTATAFAGTGWTCTLSPLSCNRGDPIAAGASAPALTLTVTVALNAAASVTNSATVSGGGDTNAGNNSDDDQTTIAGGPDLTIVKTHAGNFTQGQTGATYAITVTNSGTSATSGGITVTDTLPAGLTATALTGPGWVCVVGTLTCTRNDALAAASSYPTITVTVNVATTAPASVTNGATVAGGGETNTTNNTATDATTINPGPDLTITKTHPGSFTQGQTGATYTITVSNAGGAPTSGTVTVTDTLPAGLTATALAGSGWTCTLATRTCTRSDVLTAGGSYPNITLTVTVAGNATNSVNTVTVSGGGDVRTDNNSDDDPTTIGAGPDPAITKTRTGNLTQGQIGATYTITVTNPGNSPTSSPVIVTDLLPPGLTATSFAGGAAWTCDLPALSCTHTDPIAGGAGAPALTLTVNVAVDATGSLTNTATVAGGGDVNAGNNTATDTTTVGGGPDLTVEKTHTGNFFQGQTGATYTITVRNVGGVGTNGAITVTDTLPAGLTATAIAEGAGWTCDPLPALSCTHNGPIAAGATAPVLTLTVDVAANAPATLTNTATVAGGGDVNAGNNSDGDETTIGGGPDPTITKTHTGNFTQGQTGATYTITVTNAGSSPTSSPVIVTDALPAGLTATAFAGGAGWTCDPLPALSCTHGGAIAAGGIATALTLTVNVAINAPASLTNTATVAGGGDVNAANNTATDATAIGGGPDLTITKTHAADFTQGRAGAIYTIAVTNAGSAPTTAPVTVTDTLPAGLNATAFTGAGWICSPLPALSCTHDGAIAAGGVATLTLTVTVASDAPASVSNVATVAGGGDVNDANNTATDATNITPVALVPDLKISKSRVGDFFVGGEGAYKVTVRNEGTGPTSGEVIVEDPVPQGLTPVSASGTGWACAIQAQTVECRTSDVLPAPPSGLAPPEYPAITITVSVGLVPGPVTNIAYVSGGGDEGRTPSPPDETTILGRPQLTIIKSHPEPVVQGQSGVPFTLLVSNNGTGPTSGSVTVTDTLPAGLIPIDAGGPGWDCALSAPTVTCSRADVLGPAASYPAIEIRVDVAPGAASTVNAATVSGGMDTTPDDNVWSDTVSIAPAGQPNLSLVKEHDGDFTQGQQGAEYRLWVGNSGDVSTTGLVTVVDDLPAGLTPTSAAGTGWACTIASQNVTCSRGDALAPGSAFPQIVILVNVAADATDVVNVASSSGGGDQTTGDNTATDETRIVPRASDLTVAKRHADPFITGQQGAPYQITVTNIGTAPTSGEIVITDAVPAGLAPVSAAGQGWSCAIATRTVTCRRSDSLAPGASFPDVTLLVNVEPNASNLVNTVSVGGGGDVTPGNNTDNDSTSINVSPDPTISLGRSTPLVVMDTAEYQAVVTNLGPGLLGGETDVVAEFPPELVPLSGLGSGWQCAIAGQRIRCSRVGPLPPAATFATIQYRTLVRMGPASITVVAAVANDADSNLGNNVAINTSDSSLPVAELAIVKRTTTPRVEIGGVAGYEVDVTNTGDTILRNVTLYDRLPRGFVLVKSSAGLRSATRTRLTAPVEAGDGSVEWPLESLAPGETLTLLYLATVGAGARTGPQDNRATVEATAPQNARITAGPAIATVDVTTEAFTMLQSLVGRVFEDLDGNGMFGDGDRPLVNARVITSTGQAALTDPAGLYNIPSLGAGTVAVSLDKDTVPTGLTLVDGPGGQSWTRLLRTPIGGGGLLSQHFPLRPAAGVPTAAVPTAAVPAAPPERTSADLLPDEPDAGVVPPRRTYESRQGSSLMVALGEVSFGRAAQEFELFEKDDAVWGYGSIFYQGPLGSPENRLTFAADSRRRLNGTTDRDRLFELDPNDRQYPLFGDASVREEFATSNSKVFARLERGASYGMWGDLIGDLPVSDRDGGRWSSYQRHLTGAELRLADATGNHVTIRGAKPETAYAREVLAGGAVGWLTLRHTDLLAGTETVAIEVRDRRTPERLLSRDVLRRGVDYQLEPASGTVYLQRHVSGLDPLLNLVQVVVTYEYESAGLDQLVFGGRASATRSGLRVGGTFFTEEGLGNGRFTVGGFDLEQRLPRDGRLRLEVPYSNGTPAVESSVDSRPVDPNVRAEGFAVQAEVEQPFAFWDGVARGAYLQADDDFRNPFSATITPGATYAAASAELSPFTSSRLRFGGTYERDDTPSLDARRTTLSAEWAQSVGDLVILEAGYDARDLERNGVDLDSGLFTAQAIVKINDRLEARAGREQNLLDDNDPTYPDQTTLGARLKVADDTSIFYTQRISDAAIVPIGEFATTGFSQLATKGELNIGVESRVKDATQLTSAYRVEQGINGPDSFALIGVFTHIKLGPTVGTSFGLERGQLIAGDADNYTSGSFAVDWLPSDRFKATTRYEGRDRDGYSSRLSAGVAARLHAGVTGLTRVQWAESAESVAATGDAVGLLAALAVRPATNDRLGWLMSYQYIDRDVPLQSVAPGRSSSGWRHLFSTDGYAQPVQWLELHGKFAWQRSEVIDLRTDTYLWQARGQFALSRFVDAAIEERYLYQPASSSHREGTATEIGFWPLEDFRIAAGYNFHDTRDPFGRDLQGRDKGAYLTLSTKLSRLFNLLGSRPPQ